jgi:hypothetical protein
MLPLLPISFLIDVLLGDIVTGVKTTSKEKLIEQCNLFKNLWYQRGEQL